MTCKPPVEYADPKSVAELHEPLRSRIAQAEHDAPSGGLFLVSGRRTPYQQWLLRHERCPGHECDPAVKGHPTTALPGRSHHENRDSTHCAADMGGRDLDWLIAHEDSYGLYRAVRGEKWHFEPKGNPTTHVTPWGHENPHPVKPGVWQPIHPGDTDAIIVGRGGLDNEVDELLIRLAKRKLYAGKIDGAYGPKGEAAVVAFKHWVMDLQAASHQPVWPSADPEVGPKTIAMLRWWTA